jgi:hypothetical protein
MNCDFNNPSTTCPKCGFVARNDKVHRNCPKAPSVVRQSISFATAHTKWLAAGRPTRSPERVAEIFDTLCRPCEHFESTGVDNGSCKLCGCALKRERGLLNKINMATEGCPAQPAKWRAET